MPVYCDQCREEALENKPLKTCDGCKSVHYCSRECQKEAWKAGHKASCKSLAENRKAMIQELGKKKVKAYRSVDDYIAELRPQLAYLVHKLLEGHPEDVAVLRVVRQEPVDRRPAYKVVDTKRFSMQELEAADDGNAAILNRMRREFANEAPSGSTIPVAYALFIDGEGGKGDRYLCSGCCFPLAGCVDASRALEAHLSTSAALSVQRVTQLLNDGKCQAVQDVISKALNAAVPSVEEMMRDPACIQELLESMAGGGIHGPGPSLEMLQNILDPSKGTDTESLINFLQSNFPLPAPMRRQVMQTLKDQGLDRNGRITACEEALGKARTARK